MQALTPVVARIAVRYLSGALIAWGLVSPETGALIAADPEIQQLILLVVGAALGALTETAYAVARRSGGPT